MSVNAIDLWRWARGYSKRHERASHQYPTMRQASKRFKCNYDDIENVMGDDLGDESRYLGLGTAWKVGGGVAEIKHRGDYVIEAY